MQQDTTTAEVRAIDLTFTSSSNNSYFTEYAFLFTCANQHKNVIKGLISKDSRCTKKAESEQYQHSTIIAELTSTSVCSNATERILSCQNKRQRNVEKKG